MIAALMIGHLKFPERQGSTNINSFQICLRHSAASIVNIVTLMQQELKWILISSLGLAQTGT